jgi:sugar O-acyltransferase (sialic acid O-acetyltransferase NeuD family)
MKKALIGAGGFAREIMAHMKQHLPCFVDDLYYKDNTENILPLSSFNPNEYEVLVAVGSPIDRLNIVSRLPENTKYFSFIHSSAQILDTSIEIGEGSIVCANSILTTNIKIGKHCHLNLSTTIGHDCIIGDYFTTAPGAHISGNCSIKNCVYVGTNGSIKQGISICDNVTVGLNAGVVKNILVSGTYVGTPAKLV